MAAIYKKELRSYFTSMTGYICMAFMLVVIGIYYAVINLASGYPYFGYTLSCVIVLFLLMTPVLTMRILAEEKSRKTDQLLLTAPVSLWKIVVGKYLAMVTVFGLALLVTCFYPLILSRFGTVSLSMAYTAILGYFLYGAACIAIGLFISSVTESQVIAALLGRIQGFRSVSSSQNNNTGIPFKTIHLGQQLIQSLFTFVVAADLAITFLADGINFIDENDTRRFLFGLFEKVADLGSTHADEHLNKF